MSLQPNRPQLDSLRDILRKMEADPNVTTPNSVELKRIIHERIAKLESLGRLGGKQQEHSPHV